MSIENWWPKLTASSRNWLTENNGDLIPPEILADIEAAGGPSATDSWWVVDEDSSLTLPDEAVDWVEALTNGE